MKNTAGRFTRTPTPRTSPKGTQSAGFTLVELLILVAIITILTTIITGRFAVTVRRIREATTKSSLYILHRAIRDYYLRKGEYPETLQDLVRENCIQKIPTLYLENHPQNSYYIIGSSPTDSGRWLYDPQEGEIRIDCTHKDLEGNMIYNWQY